MIIIPSLLTVSSRHPLQQEVAIAAGEGRLKQASEAQRLDLAIHDVAESLERALRNQICLLEGEAFAATERREKLQVG